MKSLRFRIYSSVGLGSTMVQVDCIKRSPTGFYGEHTGLPSAGL